MVSGLKITKICALQLVKHSVKLLHGQDEVYNMERDNTRWWIKPDDLGMDYTKKLSIMIVGTDIQKKCLKELHERYRHISFSLIKKLPEGKAYKETPDPRCNACELGKSTKPQAQVSTNTIGPIRTPRPLERIHCDLVGPMTKEWLGNRYALTMIDDFTQFCNAIPTAGKAKTIVAPIVIRTIKQWERATGQLLCQLQADWEENSATISLKNNVNLRESN